jgi:cellulose synthase/poly-beta-1,6-N-acetylglucosamine synthase-like glycosyltransferase
MHWLPAILILPYLFLLLKLYRSLLKIKPFNASTQPVTFVSVVVACRNEQKNLLSLLNSIALQNYPDNLFEVIIVDDNSTDKTFEIAEGFNGITNLLTLYNKGKGKKQALRTGITAAKGNLVLATDADCSMGENWIRIIAAFYELNRPDMIICPVQIESVPGFLRKFQELEFLSLQGITAASAISGEATMCNGANLAFTREVYLDHSDNLHDEINSGDDIFLLHSLKKGNRAKILWMESPDTMVTTNSTSTYRSFLKQRSRWISKGKAYKDRYTIVLGIVTFVAVALQISYFIAWLIYPDLIWVFLSIIILKSIPDCLILLNTSRRYGKRNLMKWFLPSQLIYPFYVLSVVFYSLIFRNK